MAEQLNGHSNGPLSVPANDEAVGVRALPVVHVLESKSVPFGTVVAVKTTCRKFAEVPVVSSGSLMST